MIEWTVLHTARWTNLSHRSHSQPWRWLWPSAATQLLHYISSIWSGCVGGCVRGLASYDLTLWLRLVSPERHESSQQSALQHSDLPHCARRISWHQFMCSSSRSAIVFTTPASRPHTGPGCIAPRYYPFSWLLASFAVEPSEVAGEIFIQKVFFDLKPPN